MLYELAELADGSILFSFGASGAARKNVDVKVPVRLPSRYSKQFPYTAKRSKKPLTESAPVNNVPVRTLPARIPSTFSRTSPINKLSLRHVSKGTEEAEPRILAFKDVQVEENYKQDSAKVQISRPQTAFVRKSPIPSGVGKKRRSVKIEEQAGEGESLTFTQRIRPKTAFARKSPIPTVFGSGKRRLKVKPLEQGTTEASVGEAVVADKNFHLEDGESGYDLQLQKHHRLATSFIRRSPIPSSTSGNRRQRAAVQKLEGQVQVSLTNETKKSRNSRPASAFTRKSPVTQDKTIGRRKRRIPEVNKDEDKVDERAANTMAAESATDADTTTTDVTTVEKIVQSATVGTEKPPTWKSPRPKGNFARKSPISQGKRSRRSRRSTVNESSSSEGSLSENEIVRIVLDAASEAKVKEPMAAPKVFDIKSMHAEVTVEHHAEAVVEVAETDVEFVETDVEFSDDESPSSNANKDESDLSSLTLRRLKSIAKARGLKGYSKLRKAELVELLKQSF